MKRIPITLRRMDPFDLEFLEKSKRWMCYFSTGTRSICGSVLVALVSFANVRNNDRRDREMEIFIGFRVRNYFKILQGTIFVRSFVVSKLFKYSPRVNTGGKYLP